MLKPVAAVRDAILTEFHDGCASLEAITRIVVGVTLIDHISFVEYHVSKTNQIGGPFRRYERRPAPYDSLQTIVEIRYASHLALDERRLVVCKELCHSLDVDNGAHHVSNAAIQTLVETFSLNSQNLGGQPSEMFRAEQMAEVCSVELLCPLPIRKQRLQNGGGLNYPAMSEEFGLPADYVEMAFN